MDLTLDLFKQDNLFEASIKFFSDELKVQITPETRETIDIKKFLTRSGIQSRRIDELWDNIDKTYFIGHIEGDGFLDEGAESKSLEEEIDKISGEKEYPGLMIFSLEAKPEFEPTRTDLAEITRTLNRLSVAVPVLVLIRYKGQKLAFMLAERVKYKQAWREGEKIGKISILKDVSVGETHRGHLNILNEMRITKKSKVTNINELYFYWQSVFSISILNKAFYEDIISWFNQAVKKIQIPDQKKGSEKHKDFTVRLISRLIFIWFLKELKVVKEELLIPYFLNGNKNEVIEPNSEGSGYYKFILQNLFFNALNSEPSDRDSELYDQHAGSFDDPEKLKKLIFYSPYLNGGLFEIHKNDWSDHETVNNGFKVPDELFLDKDKGLNSILSRYKFTIVENTPLEEEIAVDPEMLGRIFENLLAEQSDDTQEAARKNTGAFYTPRPVVSYMCQSTLERHLDVDITPENGKQIINKLLNTTILDPACGSGAFPMGMLEEMMNVLEKVDPKGNLWVAEMLKSRDEEFLDHISGFIADGQIRYVKKLGLLRNCLFGIDILEYAVEITRLRCWLSLIVEQEVKFDEDNFNLKPLPNLEFKFYKKNSLYRKYEEHNLNTLVEQVDKEGLLKELVDLESKYFIAGKERQESKEEIKQRIVELLERVVDRQYEKVEKVLNGVRTDLNKMRQNNASKRDVNRQKKKEKRLANKLGQIAEFRETIKDYFIERVVFPGIFNTEKENPGFDIVIGNPPYVNTKLISRMGQTEKLKSEYGYCDDLYNHFIIRGKELLKSGGYLSYITSDTFLTLQTKKNIRMELLGIPHNGKKERDLFANDEANIPEFKLEEIVNTPKAFAALVDTAIFMANKEKPDSDSKARYIDIRKPSADMFDISETEWELLNRSKENLAGWERVLEKSFSELGANKPNWNTTHSCDGEPVHTDEGTSIPRYRMGFTPYKDAINYAMFSPSPYNCQILEKIVKPARPVFDNWWDKIETSQRIEKNREEIEEHRESLGAGSWSITGVLTDGGVGLQTGNNGGFVGYREGHEFAESCKVKRPEKMWNAISENPEIKQQWSIFGTCDGQESVKKVLANLSEPEIWNLFDEIKEEYGLRVFGVGFMYRIIPDHFIYDVKEITEKQKTKGISGVRCYVPYDKGDKKGNRWYAETPYLIDWSEGSVKFLKENSGKSGGGMPVVRNPQFYFRNGFCWTNVLNPNSTYLKVRTKDITVNDVGSMALYDEASLGDEYFITLLNSYLYFKLLREFFNNTVNVQMNDIRKLPVKIPSEEELSEFNSLFDQCLEIKQKYFNQEIDWKTSRELLKPIEKEVDQAVNEFYGIEITEEVEEEIEMVDEEE